MKRSIVFSSLATSGLVLILFLSHILSLSHHKNIPSSSHQSTHQQTIFDQFLSSQPNTAIALTHPHEWPASMYKDALLYSLHHHDSHVLNKNYLVPFFLMANKEHAKARQLLQNGTTDTDLAELCATNPEAHDVFAMLNSNNRGKNFFTDLENYLAKIDVTPSTTHQYKRKGYISYYAEKKEDYSLKSQETWQEKQRNIFKVLQETKPHTVLDLGANAGWFSELAEHLGARVIATDIDESCLDYLYNKSHDQKLNITTAVLPFEQCNKPDVRYRFACDTVLCLALAHHLVLIAGMKIEEIFEVLSKLTKKTLVLEFVDLQDSQIQQGLKNPKTFNQVQMLDNVMQILKTYAYKHYNLENVLSIGKKYFSSVEVIHSHPTTTRSLLIFKK